MNSIKIVAEITPIPSYVKDGCYVPEEVCIDMVSDERKTGNHVWATGSDEREAIKNFIKQAKITFKKDEIKLILTRDVQEVSG